MKFVPLLDTSIISIILLDAPMKSSSFLICNAPLTTALLCKHVVPATFNVPPTEVLPTSWVFPVTLKFWFTNALAWAHKEPPTLTVWPNNPLPSAWTCWSTITCPEALIVLALSFAWNSDVSVTCSVPLIKALPSAHKLPVALKVCVAIILPADLIWPPTESWPWICVCPTTDRVPCDCSLPWVTKLLTVTSPAILALPAALKVPPTLKLPVTIALAIVAFPETYKSLSREVLPWTCKVWSTLNCPEMKVSPLRFVSPPTLKFPQTAK